jgi:hypothetical protein
MHHFRFAIMCCMMEYFFCRGKLSVIRLEAFRAERCDLVWLILIGLVSIPFGLDHRNFKYWHKFGHLFVVKVKHR